LLKHEPSAQIPWQNTMLGLVCIELFILEPSSQHVFFQRIAD
jgi:hypothetical protein